MERFNASCGLLAVCRRGHISILLTAPSEYCQVERFNASCGPSAVVVVERASYGRANLSRCVRRNFGELGCSTPVLGQLDAACSGRFACSLPVARLARLNPCSPDLTPALTVAYRCAPGEWRSRRARHLGATALTVGPVLLLVQRPAPPWHPLLSPYGRR